MSSSASFVSLAASYILRRGFSHAKLAVVEHEGDSIAHLAAYDTMFFVGYVAMQFFMSTAVARPYIAKPQQFLRAAVIAEIAFAAGFVLLGATSAWGRGLCWTLVGTAQGAMYPLYATDAMQAFKSQFSTKGDAIYYAWTSFAPLGSIIAVLLASPGALELRKPLLAGSDQFVLLVPFAMGLACKLAVLVWTWRIVDPPPADASESMPMTVQSSLRSEAERSRERVLMRLAVVAGVVYALIKLCRYVLFGWVNVLAADFLRVSGPADAVVQASAFMEVGGLVSTVAMAIVLFIRPLQAGQLLLWSSLAVGMLSAVLYRLPRVSLSADVVLGLLGLTLTSVDSIASGPYVLEVLDNAPRAFMRRGMFVANVLASLATVLQGLAIVVAELGSWDAVCLGVAALMGISALVQAVVAARAEGRRRARSSGAGSSSSSSGSGGAAASLGGGGSGGGGSGGAGTTSASASPLPTHVDSPGTAGPERGRRAQGMMGIAMSVLRGRRDSVDEARRGDDGIRPPPSPMRSASQAPLTAPTSTTQTAGASSRRGRFDTSDDEDDEVSGYSEGHRRATQGSHDEERALSGVVRGAPTDVRTSQPAGEPVSVGNTTDTRGSAGDIARNSSLDDDAARRARMGYPAQNDDTPTSPLSVAGSTAPLAPAGYSRAAARIAAAGTLTPLSLGSSSRMERQPLAPSPHAATTVASPSPTPLTRTTLAPSPTASTVTSFGVGLRPISLPEAPAAVTMVSLDATTGLAPPTVVSSVVDSAPVGLARKLSIGSAVQAAAADVSLRVVPPTPRAPTPPLASTASFAVDAWHDDVPDTTVAGAALATPILYSGGAQPYEGAPERTTRSVSSASSGPIGPSVATRSRSSGDDVDAVPTSAAVGGGGSSTRLAALAPSSEDGVVIALLPPPRSPANRGGAPGDSPYVGVSAALSAHLGPHPSVSVGGARGAGSADALSASASEFTAEAFDDHHTFFAEGAAPAARASTPEHGGVDADGAVAVLAHSSRLRPSATMPRAYDMPAFGGGSGGADEAPIRIDLEAALPPPVHTFAQSGDNGVSSAYVLSANPRTVSTRVSPTAPQWSSLAPSGQGDAREGVESHPGSSPSTATSSELVHVARSFLSPTDVPVSASSVLLFPQGAVDAQAAPSPVDATALSSLPAPSPTSVPLLQPTAPAPPQ